eukprot:scaffold359151_cov19-Prasinocladus_malaysianus.AAC.1
MKEAIDPYTLNNLQWVDETCGSLELYNIETDHERLEITPGCPHVRMCKAIGFRLHEWQQWSSKSARLHSCTDLRASGR